MTFVGQNLKSQVHPRQLDFPGMYDYEAKTSGTHVAQALILRHFMAVKMVVMHGVFRVMSPQPAWWALPLSCALLACLKVRKL